MWTLNNCCGIMIYLLEGGFPWQVPHSTFLLCTTGVIIITQHFQLNDNLVFQISGTTGQHRWWTDGRTESWCCENSTQDVLYVDIGCRVALVILYVQTAHECSNQITCKVLGFGNKTFQYVIQYDDKWRNVSFPNPSSSTSCLSLSSGNTCPK